MRAQGRLDAPQKYPATLGNEVVLFGGYNGSTPLGDTWTFDGTSWKAVTGNGPPARYEHAMAALGNTVVIFGGIDTSGGNLGDTWVFDGASWSPVSGSGPGGRDDAAMATLP